MTKKINVNNIKAIALDLDGTLLNENHQISTFNKETIKKVELLGKKIVITTGRSYKALLPFAEELEINGPIVCYNGAAVYHSPSGNKLKEYPLNNKWAPILIKLARERDVHLHFFIDEKWYYENERKEVELYAGRCGYKGVKKDFNDIPDLSCTKAMFIGENDVLISLQKELKEIVGDDIYIAFSTDYFLEIMSKGVSKARALKETMNIENILLSEIISFGDGMNDLEMIQETAFGYAMANGSENLIKAASHIAPSNTVDGVAQVLQELFLNE
ncbi:MAG: HAD family hydrolase [Spirochaetaceae bacterium]|jgi:Cof subfamily protein (haloacid dehalogenase superfamily)|nr:HAD family hydrolase [Spirochaetaceae bacterium]